MVFDYVNKFAREHTSIPAAKDYVMSEKEYQDFVAFLADKKYDYTDKTERKIQELKKVAQKDNHFDALRQEFEALDSKMKNYKANDLMNHHEEIREILEGEIASRYYYQKGRLEANFKHDKEVNKAIEVFGNPTLYSSILNGEGPYKVIGKPGSEVQAKAINEREMDEDEKN